MPRGHRSPKLAITVDPKVHKEILAAAAREGVSVSAWMTSAAAKYCSAGLAWPQSPSGKSSTHPSAQKRWIKLAAGCVRT